MKQNQTSMTALGIAITRGIESEKPEDERICYDQYARSFVSPFLYDFVKFFDKLGWSEKKGPGVMGFLAVRDRHLDEFLKLQLGAGIQQLVILGAGYDSRAYRFDELKNGIKVFEVDHPASQKDKLQKLNKIFGEIPPHVTFVSIDFNQQKLADRLFECGYDRGLKTLFIWQGVTQYLTPVAVDDTLGFITGNSASGSSVIFDYMYPSLLDGTIKHGEVTNMRSKSWLSGESLVYGIPEGKATEFMQARGFVNIQDADAKYLHDRYFTGKNAHRIIAYGYGIVSGEVR